MFCNNKNLQELFLTIHMAGGIHCPRFFQSDWSKFKDVLFIGFLCFTNEHNIPIDLNRFLVVLGIIKKV